VNSPVNVRNEGSGNARLYTVCDAPAQLCKKDGVIFRRSKRPDEAHKVITLDEALHDRRGRVTAKVGPIGIKIVRTIASHQLEPQLVEVCLVNAEKLSVQFDPSVHPDEIDGCIGIALCSAFKAVVHFDQ
jgi:hypothetical protein